MIRSILQRLATPAASSQSDAVAIISPLSCIYTNLALENWLYQNMVLSDGSTEVHPKKLKDHLQRFDLPLEILDIREAIRQQEKAKRMKAAGKEAAAIEEKGFPCAINIPPPSQQEVILLYRNDPCLVLGRNQNPYLECNFDAMEQAATGGPDFLARGGVVPFARRLSGGGTVYHDRGNINISVISTRKYHNPARNVERLMNFVNSPPAVVFSSSADPTSTPQIVDLGKISNCPNLRQNDDTSREDEDDEEKQLSRLNTSKRHDLFLDGFKITGSAMKMGGDLAYHHYTLLVNSDRPNIGKFLSPKGKVSEFQKGKATLTQIVNHHDFEKVECVGVGSVPSPVTTLKLAGWFNPETISAFPRDEDLTRLTTFSLGKSLAEQNAAASTAISSSETITSFTGDGTATASPSSLSSSSVKEDKDSKMNIIRHYPREERNHLMIKKKGTTMIDSSEEDDNSQKSRRVFALRPSDLTGEEGKVWKEITDQRSEWMTPAWLFRCSGYTTHMRVPILVTTSSSTSLVAGNRAAGDHFPSFPAEQQLPTPSSLLISTTLERGGVKSIGIKPAAAILEEGATTKEAADLLAAEGAGDKDRMGPWCQNVAEALESHLKGTAPFVDEILSHKSVRLFAQQAPSTVLLPATANDHDHHNSVSGLHSKVAEEFLGGELLGKLSSYLIETGLVYGGGNKGSSNDSSSVDAESTAAVTPQEERDALGRLNFLLGADKEPTASSFSTLGYDEDDDDSLSSGNQYHPQPAIGLVNRWWYAHRPRALPPTPLKFDREDHHALPAGEVNCWLKDDAAWLTDEEDYFPKPF